MSGVLAGLEDATGLDLREVETFVGTSAGSIVAAHLAGGGRPRRLPSNRHNAYMKPRALDRLAEGLESFDCRHLANPPTAPVAGSSPPGCDPMEPWSLGDRPPRAFQQLARTPP